MQGLAVFWVHADMLAGSHAAPDGITVVTVALNSPDKSVHGLVLQALTHHILLLYAGKNKLHIQTVCSD